MKAFYRSYARGQTAIPPTSSKLSISIGLETVSRLPQAPVGLGLEAVSSNNLPKKNSSPYLRKNNMAGE
jgi:hypothetical protein